MLKLLGIALLVWIGLAVLGAVFKFLGTALVVGLLVFLAAAGYSAVRGRSRRSIGS